MNRVLVATTLAVFALVTPADAVLVYQGEPVNGRTASIVAARNDGSDTRIIGRGVAPRVSPNGHKVAYIHPAVEGDQLFVVGNRGRRRHLLAAPTGDIGPFVASLAWSHDGRYLVAPNARGGAWLVDVRHRTRRHVRTGGDFSGASFDPGSATFAVAGSSRSREQTLRVVDAATLEKRRLAGGAAPVWGFRGLAFSRGEALLLRKHFGERAEKLLRRRAFAFDWSADGDRLLAYEESSVARETVVIDLSPRRIRRVPHIFPGDLSRDGTEILGQTGGSPNETDGDVVVAKLDGTFTVLATNAARPTWTK
ncbi:MAG TPA: hypothetical protein VJT75_12280 [Thermoleophilaceae bacterium]|nr:hypothetical protein [Thermoleophilaceae bacterium]